MLRRKYKVIGVVSYDDDAIAHMLTQVTGYTPMTFNETFSDFLDEDEIPASLAKVEVENIIITNVVTHNEADLIRAIGGVIINAPVRNRKVLKPHDDDIFLDITGTETDHDVYALITALHENYLIEEVE